jgi:hypothetical protein
MFTILDHDRAGKALYPSVKFTDWERIQSLASEFISPSIHIHSSEEDKAAHDFSVFIYVATASRLSNRN